MRMRSVLAAVLLASALTAGCATDYGTQGFSGGYSETAEGGDAWSVTFAGNGFTTQETVQTYWLYHCAEITLAKGYQGFQILGRMDLSQSAAAGDGEVIKAYFTDHPQLMFKPSITGSIRMLKSPFKARPEARTFDAAALKAKLEPIVKGAKCDGNVCPHVHDYLYPPNLLSS